MVDPKLISFIFKSEKKKKILHFSKVWKVYMGLHGHASLQAPKIISLISLHFASIQMYTNINFSLANFCQMVGTIF